MAMQNAENGMVWGGYGAFKVIHVGNVTIRESTYDFLFNFNRNYFSILYRFPDLAQHDGKMNKLLE